MSRFGTGPTGRCGRVDTEAGRPGARAAFKQGGGPVDLADRRGSPVPGEPEPTEEIP